MIPHDQNRPQINPRELVVTGRDRELYSLISATGYVPEVAAFSDFCQSLKSGRPWLISGTRGSGKTAFPEAVAEACNLTVCVVAGRDGIAQSEVLYDWDREEQAAWMNEHLELARRAKSKAAADKIMSAARAGKWKRDFLILGEMGLAYDLAARAAEHQRGSAPPILILDESDKFGASLEDAMLMPLERGLIFVPRLDCGFVGVRERAHRPFVVTTSNNLRHRLSAPFVSRHVFSGFATPPIEKEIEILRARCPLAGEDQVALGIKLLDAVRGVAGIEDHPSLRESIDLVDAFHRDGIRDLDEETLARYFCYFAKTQESQDYLRLQLDYLLLSATSYHPVIDPLLQGGGVAASAFEAEQDIAMLTAAAAA